MSHDRPAIPLVPVGDPVEVSTETPLMSWRSWPGAQDLVFALLNLEAPGGHQVVLVLETSEDGVHPDLSVRWEILAQPGSWGSKDVVNSLRTWWRVSAYSKPPDHPPVLVQFKVIGRT